MDKKHYHDISPYWLLQYGRSMRGKIGLWVRIAFHSLEDIGIQPQKLLGLRSLPTYIHDLTRFWRMKRHLPDATNAAMQLAPQFSDRFTGAGTSRTIYFLQDLTCSTRVLSRGGVRHLDIGSRVDGFVAQIASSRAIDVLDFRPLNHPPTPNLRFIQGDILNPPANFERKYDLVSSLHALEHVGLGRYGDPIGPDGFERALKNAGALVASGGSLMISLPVAEIERNLVQFNSQRLFSHACLAELLRRLLPDFEATWSLVVDETRSPRQCLGDPEPLLMGFHGYGICAVELMKK